jgi:hypothetical protein
MSLFDRYDQNKAESFIRHTCFVSTREQRFEDLFEQIHQHFPQLELFSSSENEILTKNSMDRLILHDENVNDLFLESVSHLLVFNLVNIICLFIRFPVFVSQ